MQPFHQDSSVVERVEPSPNFDERTGLGHPDMIVLHYTGMQFAHEAIHRLCDPKARVSSHYVVLENGSIVQLVQEAMRAWHAGVSVWGGDPDINSRSIGIEICNPGHEFGYRGFSAAADRGDDHAVPLDPDAPRHPRRTTSWRIPTSRRPQAGSGREISLEAVRAIRRRAFGSTPAPIPDGRDLAPERHRHAGDASCSAPSANTATASMSPARYDVATPRW